MNANNIKPKYLKCGVSTPFPILLSGIRRLFVLFCRLPCKMVAANLISQTCPVFRLLPVKENFLCRSVFKVREVMDQIHFINLQWSMVFFLPSADSSKDTHTPLRGIVSCVWFVPPACVPLAGRIILHVVFWHS